MFTDTGQCSLNFLFKGDDGQTYIGTAGHCLLADGEEEVWSPGWGPVATDGEGNEIGKFVYASRKIPPQDFALIRLNRRVESSPEMCYWGGPTGINSDLTNDPVLVRHFGHGTGVGWEPVTGTYTVSARTGLAAFGLPDPDLALVMGAVAFGDSGSGAISEDGRALGVIVTLGTHFGPDNSMGVVGITRLKPQLKRAQRLLGIRLALQRAELLP